MPNYFLVKNTAKNTAKYTAQNKNSERNNHLTAVERYTESKWYGMTELNVRAGKTQGYEEPGAFHTLQQNCSPITRPTWKACHDKRAKLRALTYVTENSSWPFKNSTQLH